MLLLGDSSKMIIEVAIFAIGSYVILRFLRETRGSGVIRGLTMALILGVLTFFTLISYLSLDKLGMVFRQVTNVAIVGLIVVFQPEIRSAIVRLGQTNLFGRFLKREVLVISRLIRSVARLSRDHIGALIAIERQNPLASHVETGINIDAELNSYLIESVFYPGNSLHDGAIIIRHDRIVAASCLLPLSQNPEVDKRLGTRHRAALGLAEETDALVVVVSEETGKISAAIGGKLQHGLSLEALERVIEESMHDKRRSVVSRRTDDKGGSGIWGVFGDPWRKLAAVGIGLVLWFVLDSQVKESFIRDFTVEVNSSSLAANSIGVTLDKVYKFSGLVDEEGKKIDTVQVTLEGSKNDIQTYKKRQLKLNAVAGEVLKDPVTKKPFVRIDAAALIEGNEEFEDLIDKISPGSVKVLLEQHTTSQFALKNTNVHVEGLSVAVLPRLDNSFTFSSAVAKIIGPSAVITALKADDELFVVKVTDDEVDPNRVVTLTKIIELSPDERFRDLRLEESVTVDLVFVPDWRDFQLTDVPIDVDTAGLVGIDRSRLKWDAAAPEQIIGAADRLLQVLRSKFTDSRDNAVDVHAEWTRQHARLRYTMTQGDWDELGNSGQIERTPVLELFTLGGEKTIYTPSKDYRIPDIALIKITLEKE